MSQISLLNQEIDV